MMNYSIRKADMRTLMMAMLCVIFGLSGCQQIFPSSRPLQEEKQKKILSGTSLESARYTIEIPEDIMLRDDHLLSDSYSIMTVPSDDYDFAQYSLNGDCTILNLLFWYANGTEQIPIMYLQAFDKANYDGSKFIQINDKKYKINQLESDIVYQDSKMIVYNFYPYIEEISFEDFLQQSIYDINKADLNETDWPKDRKKILLNFDDYQYLLDAQTYINQNISNLITPMNG